MEVQVRNHSLRSGAIVAGALVAGLSLTRLYSFLLFHTVVELFTIAVAWSIFFLAWNARRFLDNHYLLFVGIASLFVGIIDSVHALAYKGMSIFPGAGADMPTQFWIAGRLLQSVSFLLAPIFLVRRVRPGLTAGAFGVVTLALVASVFGGVFPTCYVDGAGLTRFKILSEFAVCGILLAAAAVLARKRRSFDALVFRSLTASVVLTAIAELAFTTYADVYGIGNVTGHLLRFVAFCLIYRAILVTGIERPFDLLFRDLSRSEEALRFANAKLEETVSALRQSDERYRVFVANGSEGICRVEMGDPISIALPEEEQLQKLLDCARTAECNDAYARMHGRPNAADMIGMPLAQILRRSGPASRELLREFVRSGYRLVEAEAREEWADGSVRWIAGSFTGVVENGALVRAWGVQRDITERKRAAEERERLIGELKRALAEVKTLSGLLPICASCKKIRDDKGYWTQVESYLHARTDLSFSHGICPDCARRLYPEYYTQSTRS